MRHRKWVTVVAFAAATAVGCIVVRKLRQRVRTCCAGATYPASSWMCIHVIQSREYGDLTCFSGHSQGKPASDEPKKRNVKHPKRPTTGTGKTSGSLASHHIDTEDDSEAVLEQGGSEAHLLPGPVPDTYDRHTRHLSQSQLLAVPAAVVQAAEAAAVPSLQRPRSEPSQLDGEQALDEAPLASQAGVSGNSPASPAAIVSPATEPAALEAKTEKAVANGDKAAQGDVKQPAAQSTCATGLIAAFRPVEQHPASSAAASLPAGTAGSNASDRQAADDLQVSDFRSHVDALLLRAKIPRLELPAHRPEDAHEKESAGTSVCLSTLPLLLQC